MKKVKVVDRIIDYLKNEKFYEALFKEIESEIIKDMEISRNKKKKPSTDPGIDGS